MAFFCYCRQFHLNGVELQILDTAQGHQEPWVCFVFISNTLESSLRVGCLPTLLTAAVAWSWSNIMPHIVLLICPGLEKQLTTEALLFFNIDF